MKRLITSLLLFGLISLPGISFADFSKVRLKYSRAVLPLSIVPVYPLNDNIKPGDIIVLRSSRTSYLLNTGVSYTKPISPFVRLINSITDDPLTERAIGFVTDSGTFSKVIIPVDTTEAEAAEAKQKAIDTAFLQFRSDFNKAWISGKQPLAPAAIAAYLANECAFYGSSLCAAGGAAGAGAGAGAAVHVAKRLPTITYGNLYASFTVDSLTAAEANTLIPTQTGLAVKSDSKFTTSHNASVSFKDMSASEIPNEFWANLLKLFSISAPPYAPQIAPSQWFSNENLKEVKQQLVIKKDSPLLSSIQDYLFGDDAKRLQTHIYLIIPRIVIYSKTVAVSAGDGQSISTTLGAQPVISSNNTPSSSLSVSHSKTETISLQAQFQKPMAVGMLPVYLEFQLQPDGNYRCTDIYSKI